MSKKFKLVYVKEGNLFGSYSGIPGTKDVLLISRAALEGTEAPKGDIPEGYILPEGTIEILENGNFDISQFASIAVNVAIPEGYVVPEGQVLITENGETNVAGKATVVVNVPIPAGYIQPSGSLNITENGTNIDVTAKASVNVNVPIPAGYIVPEGSLDITANGNNIDVTDKASINVNVPNPSSGTLEITENGDNIDVSQYAYVDVDVEGSSSFEANYLYPTDENGAILSEQGQELDDIHIYYDDNGLTSLYPGSGSVYFFENNIPHAINMMTGCLYYYDGNPCGPISQCFESSVSDGDIYIGDTNTNALIRQLSFPEDSAALINIVAEGSDPQDGDYYEFRSEAGCPPLVKQYFQTDTLYWWPNNGGGPISGNDSLVSDIPYLVSAGSNAILAEQVGNLEIGEEVTVELDGNTYTVTRTA